MSSPRSAIVASPSPPTHRRTSSRRRNRLTKHNFINFFFETSFRSILGLFIRMLTKFVWPGHWRCPSYCQACAGHFGLQDHSGGQGQESLLHPSCGSCRCQAHRQARGNIIFSHCTSDRFLTNDVCAGARQEGAGEGGGGGQGQDLSRRQLRCRNRVSAPCFARAINCLSRGQIGIVIKLSWWRNDCDLMVVFCSETF